ncbi:hypothetical protein OIU77_025295 [Salix suchowensis]|uniref:Uncharacterized protein n=1 Tax=Salix suchowensis TaxID=1278906 RepID=A0ABQ9C023_9ROSI|nr:hypothetical protein OIU77_025295 [Salix suchowensis]
MKLLKLLLNPSKFGGELEHRVPISFFHPCSINHREEFLFLCPEIEELDGQSGLDLCFGKHCDCCTMVRDAPQKEVGVCPTPFGEESCITKGPIKFFLDRPY